jgi:hypothetical protein
MVAASAATVLVAQAAYSEPDARSLREVETIWVDSNSCTDGISEQLRDRGFHVTRNERAADAILNVDVFDRSSRREDTAKYQARLHGDDDRVIFSASGTEYAGSYPELCDEIGERIAESMDSMG